MVPHWSVKWTQLHSLPFTKHSCGFLATCLTCMLITPTPNNPMAKDMLECTTGYNLSLVIDMFNNSTFNKVPHKSDDERQTASVETSRSKLKNNIQ